MRSSLLFGFVVAGLLGFTGCTIPVSDFPLTDDKTSTPDERLIGYWNYVPKTEDEHGPPTPYVIGRMKGQPNVLQMTWVELDDEQVATVKQIPLYTTKIGDEQYLSYPVQNGSAAPEPKPAERAKEVDAADDKVAQKTTFMIARYEISEEGLGRLFIMLPDLIAGAIESGKLKGVVTRQARKEGDDPNKEPPVTEIRITAEPKDLAEFVTKHGKACFAADEPMTFQRVKLE